MQRKFIESLLSLTPEEQRAHVAKELKKAEKKSEDLRRLSRFLQKGEKIKLDDWYRPDLDKLKANG